MNPKVIDDTDVVDISEIQVSACGGCSGQRHWHDKLVVTSGIYIVSGVVSAAAGQWTCGALQVSAGIASTAYHKSKETRFLHLDALVSSTLGLIAIWVITHAYSSWALFLIPAIIQLIFCAFSWIYCGLPGSPRYDDWHTYWHYASGISTAGTSAYLLMYIPHFDVLLMEYASSIIEVTFYW